MYFSNIPIIHFSNKVNKIFSCFPSICLILQVVIFEGQFSLTDALQGAKFLTKRAIIGDH